MTIRISSSRRSSAWTTLAGSVLLAALVAALHLPGGNVNTAQAASNVSFKKDIQSIFTVHCAACHIGSAVSGGLNLGSYKGLQKGGSVVKGAVFVPKHHAKSYLWQIIQPKGSWPGGNRMPLGGPYLSGKEIATITTWIDQGARNN